MNDGTVNSQFRQQLPFQVLVMGRSVTFDRSSTGKIAIDIDDAFTDIFESASSTWDHRKGIQINGPEQRSNFASMKERLHSKKSVRQFLLFLVRQPIGPRLFIFDQSQSFDRYIGRQAAINEAYLTWDALTNWERDRNGKLVLSIACAGYRKRLAKYESEPEKIVPASVSFCMCSSNVSDPTGCCGTHKKSGSRTIFNYYPFFKVEGFPELDL
ncbi:MAG: hypothetical protein KDA79_11970 [Planctomycetaceae bacterium]|nr:hypothetical protein [Planctomycetaceae bacterium]